MNPTTFFSVLISFAFFVAPVFSKIEAGQAVKIEINRVPAEQKKLIDANYKVSDAGLVNLPFIGEFRASGLEPEQLAKAIEDAFLEAKIFKDVKVRVGQPMWNPNPVEMVVHVGGQVREPGPRPFKNGLTVFQAVQAAGGATEFAAMDRVKLYREGKTQKIDLTKAEGKGVITMLDDTIEVPQKNLTNR